MQKSCLTVMSRKTLKLGLLPSHYPKKQINL